VRESLSTGNGCLRRQVFGPPGDGPPPGLVGSVFTILLGLFALRTPLALPLSPRKMVGKMDLPFLAPTLWLPPCSTKGWTPPAPAQTGATGDSASAAGAESPNAPAQVGGLWERPLEPATASPGTAGRGGAKKVAPAPKTRRDASPCSSSSLPRDRRDKKRRCTRVYSGQLFATI